MIYDSNAPKSYQDCIVKKLAKLKHNTCISHRRWTYGKLSFTNSMSKNQTVSCSKKNYCPLKKNNCQKSCFNEFLIYNLISSNNWDFSFMIMNRNNEQLLFNHFPKFEIINYISKFAGLVSFWFGYFIFQISLKFFDRLRKFSIFIWIRFFTY